MAGAQLVTLVYESRYKEVPDVRLLDVMKNVYAVLLSLVGLICIIFNRFAVEESLRILPTFVWPRLPVWICRIIVILSGTFFVLFGVLTMTGYLQ
jgi:hypothetical protein